MGSSGGFCGALELAHWLNTKAQALTAAHKPEYARRGINGPGAKGDFWDRIAAHVVSHPGGFTHGSTDYEAFPVGYSYRGTFVLRCREDGCVTKSAAPAKEAAAETAATEGATEKAPA